jgi:hypothetical protein
VHVYTAMKIYGRMLLDGLKHVVTERRGMDEKTPLLTAFIVIRIVPVDSRRQ